MNGVTKQAFLAEIDKYDFTTEKDGDTTNGYQHENYIDRATGREIGFVSYHAWKETTYHLWSAGV